MRLLFGLILLLGALWPPAAGAQTTGPTAQISLADLGYSGDVTLRGPSASIGVGFPLPAQGIAHAELALHLDASPMLNAASGVSVAVNERTVATRAVAQIRSEPIWRVPLPATTESLLSVRIETTLSASNNRCDDLASGNLWVVLGRASSLSYGAVPTRAIVREFFRVPGGRVVVAGAWDTAAHQAASIALFGAVRYLTRGIPVDVEFAEDATAPDPRAPARPERAVRLLDDTRGAPIRLEGDTLWVRGDAATLRLLTSPDGEAMLLGPGVTSVATPVAVRPRATCGPNRICLSDLGIGHQGVSGIGSMRTSFTFTPAALGGWPTGLELALNAAFDRVPTDTLERALVRVWLNGALLETIDVRGRSGLVQSIALPATVVEPANFIEVEFVYAPVAGNCQGAPVAFTGQVRSSTALTWGGLEALPPRVGAIVAADPTVTELYLVEATPAMARAMALTVGALAVQIGQAVIPTPEEPASFARSRAGLRLVASPRPEQIAGLGLALSLGEPVSIRNRQTGRELMRAVPDGALAAFELAPGGPPTLVLQASRSADAPALEGFVRRVTDPRRFSSLVGSVVVGNADDVVALQFGAGGVEARPERLSWWDRYVLAQRPLWYLLLAVLVMGALYVTWKRLGRRPAVSPSPM
jgi:hypothetical protein